MRIGGLATGMDTQQIIDDLMRAERMPLDKLTQQRQTLEWKRDDYREMNRLLKKFDDFIFNNMFMRSTFMPKTVMSSDTSKVSATATASAGGTSYTITSVDRLATSASNISEAAISADENNKIDPSKSIWSQRDKFQNQITWQQDTQQDEINVSRDGNTFRLSKGAIDSTTLSTNDVISVTKPGVDGEPGEVANYNITYDRENIGDNEVFVNIDTGELIFGGDPLEKGSTIEANYDYNYLELGITDFEGEVVDFTFDGTQSLNQMLNRINNSSADVSAFYDEHNDKVVLNRTEAGVGASIEFVGENNFFRDVLNFDEVNENEGQNAKFTINGLETERSSNTFTIDGVTFTLKDTFENGSVTLNAVNETDKVVDSITEFVNQYNELILAINEKTREPRHRDYHPLSEEEKRAMSDREVELWEEKAQSGLLRNDPLLRNGLNQFRMDVYNTVSGEGINGDFNLLSKIGISPSSDYRQNGMLEIDENKLRSALEEDPDSVYQLFMANGNENSEKGIARRLRSTISSTIRSVESRAGNDSRGNHQFTIGREINSVEDRISNFERRLQQIEERYWNQFTAMERAMQRANAQADQLFSFMGNGMW
ncbi:flagellar filament capping protein FliD [Desertibacillus haloalkaliphilus]|uniref:flagellar filament capping protein FliD n=1 Tax=Desertibacillus haloalkaliphilus TaxID=1328930 RepID=UPI001C25D6DC|nr:flagellar filament capping protein FliD [Desertibacillus haloalkaliphilus]MBU8908701.1 flagellar filament capping protein FliD [Desertibacillus haloalkaliphilus]